MDGIRSLWIMVWGEFELFRLWQGLVAFAAALALGLAGQLAPRVVAVLDRWIAWLAARPRWAIPVAGLLAVAVRMACLPVSPVPSPVIHDEFSHLLLADTLLHGRLANPPHPFADHFEVAHVLQHPTYASVYPPGPGASLALGRLLFRHPWAGVLLTFAAMGAACCWMLYGWTTPRWALAGGVACGFLYGFFGQWLNSYWGGSFAAAGGGLLFGALPRLAATRQARYTWIGMAGWAMGWFARPFEALVLGVALAAAAVIWLVRTRDPWIVRAVGVPAAAAVILVAAFTGYYNWRVTADPLVLPYQLGQRSYGFPQSFAWQEFHRPTEFKTPALRDNFLWQVENRQFLLTPWQWGGQLLKRVFETWRAYWGVALLLPVLFFFAANRDPGRLFLAALGALLVIANSFYSFFFAHYFAAYTCVFLLFALEGVARISRLRLPAAPIAALGFGLFALLQAAGLFDETRRRVPIQFIAQPRRPLGPQLAAIPGRHLVFVNYEPDHIFHFEWCYNGADIDGATVVWANRLSPERDRALRRYFADRRVWIVDADADKPGLRPFEP